MDRRAAILIAMGEIDRAEALLCHTQVRSDAARLTARLAEVRMWQGRFEEAAALLKRRRSTRAVILRGVLAWACGDQEGVRRIARRVSRARGASARVWKRAFEAFAAPERHSARCAERALLAAIEGATRRVRSAHAPPFHRLLRAWTEGAGATRALRAEITHFGAAGILRWKRGVVPMYLTFALPSLVEDLHGADDELAALKAACGWGRRHGGVSWIGFVAGDPGRVIVAEGKPAPRLDLSGGGVGIGQATRAVQENGTNTVSEPVRYAGQIVGAVIVSGDPARAQSMREVTNTLAVMCGPALRQRMDVAARNLQATAALADVLGRSPAIAALRETVARVAPTPFSVLIEGESGTGKELVARALHRLSPRRDRRFCAVNCAALTDDLVEAELFGHTRGAFTGAVDPRVGLFEDARGGTLFLDEAAELSPRAQAKILRVLQEREVRRVGENASRAIDVRVVAATNAPLGEACANGRFREDLLFRLAVVRIRLPPLRDRLEDLPQLACAFWKTAMRDVGKAAALGSDALVTLSRHDWPGNIRELQNAIAALAVLAPVRGRVGARHVHHVLADIRGPDTASVVRSLDEARRSCEQQTIAAALARHGGRRTAAARDLGVSRQGLLKAMRRVGLLGQQDATRTRIVGVA